MAFHLDQVVPWERSFDEYVAMFALETQNFGRRILGCGDGPASFNAELSPRGGAVVSVDPLTDSRPRRSLPASIRVMTLYWKRPGEMRTSSSGLIFARSLNSARFA